MADDEYTTDNKCPNETSNNIKNDTTHTRDYTNLPVRRVKGARNKSPILSYGFIIMTMDTGRLLAVKRRYSPGYTVLLLGKYRTGNVTEIVSNLTIHEYYSLQALYENNFNDLHIIMNEISRTDISMDDVSYVKNRLIDDRLLIENNKYKVLNKNLEWGWPKGRKKNKAEPDRKCAERELEEETGLVLDDRITIFINNKMLRESFIGFNGLSFVGNFYMALVQNEIICTPKDKYEIGECSWLNYKELKSSLSKARIKLLNNAYNILNQERSKLMVKKYNIDIHNQTYKDVVIDGLQYNDDDDVYICEKNQTIPDDDSTNNAWHLNLIKKRPNAGMGVFNITYNSQTLEYGIFSL